MRLDDPDEHARQDHTERMNHGHSYSKSYFKTHWQNEAKLWEEFVESTRSLAEYEQSHDEEFRMQAGRVDLITETLEDEDRDREELDDEAYGNGYGDRW